MVKPEEIMDYSDTLQAAGAKIIEYKEFGSYQGDWLAFVEYNGEKGIISGSYGSCSGCDALQATFGWSDSPTIEKGVYYKDNSTWDEESICTKEEYEQALIDYNKKVAEFGEDYLKAGLYKKDFYQGKLDKINDASEDDWFSSEEKEICEWVLSLDF